MPAANLKFGPMLIENFGPFVGKHVFDWQRGPALWYIAGRNLREPALGANGAGKTTLLVALFWCLFGQTLRNSRPGERVEPWHGKGTTSVRIGFVRDGQKYDLYRSRKPNKLTLNDQVVTDDEVLRLLPAPEVMLYSFLVGQTNTLFLDLKPEPQSRLFTDLLELDLWISAAERAGATATAANREIDKTDLEISSVEGRIVELREGLQQLEVQEHEYESETNRQLASIDIEITELRRQVKAADTVVAKLKPATNQELANLEQQETEADKAVRSWERKLATIRGELRAANQDGADFSAELSKMIETEKCPTCDTELIKTDFQALRDRLEARTHESVGRIETLNEQLADATAQLAGWSKDLAALRQQIAAARKAAENHQLQRSDAKRRAATVAASLSGRQQDRQQIYESKNPYTEQLAGRNERIAFLTGDLVGLTTERAESLAVRDTAKLWQDAFRSIRLGIIEDTLAEVSLAANKHAERLGLAGWYLEFATERQTAKGTTSLGFTTFLYPPDMDRPIPWDSYSGGESQRLQLAVSFGLGEVLLARAGIAPNVEILDEPTDGLSDEGIKDLLDCLANRAQETGRTIWIIDHNSLDRGSFDGTILVEKTEDGSRIIQ